MPLNYLCNVLHGFIAPEVIVKCCALTYMLTNLQQGGQIVKIYYDHDNGCWVIKCSSKDFKNCMYRNRY